MILEEIYDKDPKFRIDDIVKILEYSNLSDVVKNDVVKKMYIMLR